MKKPAILVVLVAFFLSLITADARIAAVLYTEKLQYRELWSSNKNTTLRELSKTTIHPDGKYIVATYFEDAKIFLIDASSGKTIEKFASARFEDAKITIVDLVWSNSGRFLASALLFETVEVWEWSDAELKILLRIALDGRPYSVRWSPDDKYLSITSENGGAIEGSIWDARTGKKITTFPEPIAQMEWRNNADKQQVATIDWNGTSCLMGHPG